VVYVQESGASIHRRRRRQRAVVTLTTVTLLLLGGFLYATAYVQGWVNPAASPVTTAKCRGGSSTRILTPSMVRVNVYNASNRDGLGASVAESLQRQGFNVATVGNDPLGRSIQEVGEIRRGPTGDAGAALAATRFSGATVVPDRRTDDSVDIVLGNRFRSVGSPPKGARPKAVKLTRPC
jgi:hypothetical protein